MEKGKLFLKKKTCFLENVCSSSENIHVLEMGTEGSGALGPDGQVMRKPHGFNLGYCHLHNLTDSMNK